VTACEKASHYDCVWSHKTAQPYLQSPGNETVQISNVDVVTWWRDFMTIV